MITPLGLALLMLPALVMGFGMTRPHLIPVAYMTGVGVLLLMAADHLLSRRLSAFDASRQTDDTLSVGARHTVTIRVRNLSRLRLRMTVKDDPPVQFRTPQREVRVVLAPLATHLIEYETQPASRGDYSFGNLHFRTLTILGLTYWQRTIVAPQDVAVYPNLVELQRYEQLARAGRLTQVGFRPYRRPAMGTEFESLREYVPDDQYRHIDWKATARRRKPITRQFQAERSQSLMLMLDAGRLMAGTAGLMSKLDHAVNAALMLAHVAVRRDDRVGLLVFADSVEQFVAPGKGKAQVQRLADALYAVQPRLHEPDYLLAFSTLFSRSRKRSLVICFTDLIDRDASSRLLSGMASLYPRHLPLLVAVQDPELQAAVGQYPADAFESYEKAVAIRAAEERKAALSAVSGSGVLVLDVAADDLSVSIVNRYLEIKDRHTL